MAGVPARAGGALSAREYVLAYLKQHPGATLRDISSAYGFNYTYISVVIAQMVRDKQVRKWSGRPMRFSLPTQTPSHP